MHDLDRTFMEMGIAGEQELEQGEFTGEREWGEVFSESEVQELAAELLSVSNEQELQGFLGDLIKKAGRTLGSVVSSPVGQALGGVLKSVASKALPIAGAALGNMIVPGVGGALGGKLASAAGSMFGLELEGLSQEDRDFEVAKQFVRLAGDASSSAVQAAQAGQPVNQSVRDAVTQAAQKFAPGLLVPATPAGTGPHHRHSGRWVRTGHTIVLHGV